MDADPTQPVEHQHHWITVATSPQGDFNECAICGVPGPVAGHSEPTKEIPVQKPELFDWQPAAPLTDNFRFTKALGIAAVFIATIALMFAIAAYANSGQTGPQGPIGPIGGQGEQGEDGPQGPPGPPGKDAVAPEPVTTTTTTFPIEPPPNFPGPDR